MAAHAKLGGGGTFAVRGLPGGGVAIADKNPYESLGHVVKGEE